jgi:hypothetical protein
MTILLKQTTTAAMDPTEFLRVDGTIFAKMMMLVDYRQHLQQLMFHACLPTAAMFTFIL